MPNDIHASLLIDEFATADAIALDERELNDTDWDEVINTTGDIIGEHRWMEILITAADSSSAKQYFTATETANLSWIVRQAMPTAAQKVLLGGTLTVWDSMSI
jgi:hypothetical protein